MYPRWYIGGEPNCCSTNFNMAPASKDDVGVQHAVVIQQSHRIVERK